jgi:chitinase
MLYQPFLYDENKKLMVSYDDPQSFAAKGKFISQNDLLGFYMWDVTGDYNDLLVDAITPVLVSLPSVD